MDTDGRSLIGTFEQKLDRQGRLLLPEPFAGVLGDSLYVTRGLDGCLFAMHPSDVEAFCQKLSTLPLMLDEARAFNRLFLSGTLCRLDRRRRFELPEGLRAYAGLGEDVVLAGVLNRVEIWSRELWAQEMAYMRRQFHVSSAELASRGI